MIEYVILVPVAARALNSRLGPGAVLVLVVLSIAVGWGIVISARTDARFVAWYEDVQKGTQYYGKGKRRDKKEGKRFKFISSLNLLRAIP